MIYPENFETKIRFDKVRELLKKQCLSTLGRDLVEELKFSESFNRVSRRVNETNEFKTICLQEENFPLGHFIDVRSSLDKIRIDGTYLELEELFDLKRSLESISAILRFFKNKEEGSYPHLMRLTGNVKMYPYIFDRINAILTKHGRMKDNASPELMQVRSNLAQKQASISRRMQALLRAAQKDGWVDQDVSLSVRDGRAVIPVASAYKRKIKGIVHDESATGKTSYIEPAEIVETNNEIRELEYAERREMIKVLREFTEQVRPYVDDLFHAYAFLAQIDFIRAKAKFAIQVNGLLPQMRKTASVLWENAVHPLLYLTLQGEGRKAVPLNIEINDKQRIVLISGPNAGGKSVCLQTMGLLQYMFQCGLLVPMSEKSNMGIFDNIFIDIGDEQSMENDLSTYSSHLMNMKHFLKYSNAETLMMIDEFGTGTEPALGGAIAESILDKLNRKQVKGVITTHYTGLKHYASEAEGIENGAMLYDSHKMQPLFQLHVGKPGSSFAFEIARKIGLPEEILKLATDKIGGDHINFDKHLRDIVRDKRYWETKREKIRVNEKKLAQLVERYEIDLKETSSLRKEIISKAQEEAKQLLNQANKSIEKTIREIKESKAEKEKTRQVRKAFEEQKEVLTQPDLQEEERINRKIQKLKDRENQVKKITGDKTTQSSSPEKAVSQKKKQFDPSIIEKGDSVKLDAQRTIGEVIEVNDKTAVVAFGALLTSVKLNRLTKVSKTQAKKENTSYNQTSALVQEKISKRKLTFRRDIDVRGMRAEEALQIVMDHVDEAIMLDISEFRILHGTGHGILRKLIRDYLNTVQLVRSCTDEKIQMGGSGITVVHME
ncbi:endonuclease MutS2 [Ancylomarina euxinus]|uniref:Endonuclease MutS2 n=1 Tax=Ancylomarina euxinus TaxID=2283627 RepID=A0A425Y5W7_9BACT|nr:Smr/MutS family protein [Ancylomarina euxinus]MCZ4694229.1 Smr/MutS family protein [Ancylomarina euxinus]MUP14440.1 endonuclease MutS2 [Ancylomarina euxinus]RRG23744.1 endonuclease MutS2 [Ancylomarina euxinus]